MKEFIINDYLTIKLEDGIPKILVDGNPVLHHSHLLKNVPIDPDKAKEISDVDSIDKIMAIRNQYYVPRDRPVIPPETEFWGFCSNLQAWEEHDYDTRLLHSRASFPLLRMLTDAGDPKAKQSFTKEIAKRYVGNYKPVKDFLLTCGYLIYLEKEELERIGVPRGLIKSIFQDKERMNLIPIHVNEIEQVYQDIIRQILENRKYHTKEFYRIAYISEFPSLLIADFSTIDGKYPSISPVYFRFIIAKKSDYPKLSDKYLQDMRFERCFVINLEENVIKSEVYFVTLFEMMNFHFMDRWN